MAISDTDRLNFQEEYRCTWYPGRRNGEGVLCYDMPRRELQAPTYREALDRAIEKTKYPLTGGVGWVLAMRVCQSDLYAQLDGAEKAACDELAHCNPYFAHQFGVREPIDPESHARGLPPRTALQFRFEDIDGPAILAKEKHALSRAHGTGEYTFADTQKRFSEFCVSYAAYKRSLK